MLSILPIHSCVTAWTFCNDSAAVFTTVRTNVVGFPVSMLTFNRLGRDITLARLIVASEEPAIACRDSSTPIIVNASCSSHIEINPCIPTKFEIHTFSNSSMTLLVVSYEYFLRSFSLNVDKSIFMVNPLNYYPILFNYFWIECYDLCRRAT